MRTFRFKLVQQIHKPVGYRLLGNLIIEVAQALADQIIDFRLVRGRDHFFSLFFSLIGGFCIQTCGT